MPKFSSKIWPIHTQPVAGELLSSWMVRIAQGNRSKVYTFYASHFGRDREIWARDIDHFAPTWLIEELSVRTGCSLEKIHAMTLRSLETVVFTTFNEVGETKFILPLSVFHRKRRAFGQQFCVLCLSSDTVSYLRKSWRIGCNTICPEHQILLQDRCNYCSQPISPHRADINNSFLFQERTSMHRCVFCRKEFCVSTRSVTAEELEMQSKIDLVIEAGYVEICPGTTIYSHLYLEGIRILMSGLSKLGAPDFDKLKFEHATAGQRLIRLLAAFRLLENWPENFLKYCSDKKAPYSAFCPNLSETPYWLSSIFRKNLFKRYAPVSNAEFTSIIDVVEKSGCRALAAGVRQLSGRDTSRLHATLRVDDDIADILLASIDHCISSAPGIKQLALLRDKVMFITARCLNLSVNDLLKFDANEFTTETSPTFSFWDRVESKSQVNAMLCWYCQYSRAQTGKYKPEALFFIHNGKRLNKSSVGMRFKRAVQLAGLERSISSWRNWVAK